jgi:hypothetical protein
VTDTKIEHGKVGDVIVLGPRTKEPFWHKTSEPPPGAYVIERAVFEGGGYGHGRNDVYPNVLHVDCRRVGEADKETDWTYDADAPLYQFTWSTGYANNDAWEACHMPTIIGSMRRTFVDEGDRR